MKDFASVFNIPNTRWLGWVAIVFLLQIAVIAWVSDYGKPSIRKPSPAPRLALTGPGSRNSWR